MLTLLATLAIANHEPIRPTTHPFAIAQTRDNPPSRRVLVKKEKRNELLQKLNLSDAQKRQITTIRQKYQGQMQTLHEQLRTAHEGMGQLMAGTATDAAIRSKNQEIAILRQKLDNLRLESMLEIRQVMTPQQRSQFQQIMKAERDRHGRPPGRNGQGQGRPPMPPPNDEF